MATRIDRRDLPWVVLIVLSFIIGLSASWERWGNLLVDCGREMNQALRLSRGEMLYSDVRHIYGPLSPYVNATLFRIFGPSLNVLYADGIITAIIIISLVYWLARQLMGRAPSAAAAVSVMWLCGFKQAGNYVLPYSYSALHACALGLATLALAVRFVQRAKTNDQLIVDASGDEANGAAHTSGSRSSGSASYIREAAHANYYLFAAGIMAGLTTLAKTEMGLAALIAGAVAALLIAYPGPRRSLALGVIFMAPAVAIVVTAYLLIANRVGWETLSRDSFLFFQNLPDGLVYFNKRVSGFDQPAQSVAQMLFALLRLALVAVVIAVIVMLLTRKKKERSKLRVSIADGAMTDAGRANFTQLRMLLALSALGLLSLSLTNHMQWDKGPYLAMPLILTGLLIRAIIRAQKQRSERGRAGRQILVMIVVCVYAMASLARVVLRVRSGGAYSSYLLPASVILFTYCWTYPFPNLFRDGRARRFARNIAIGLIMGDVIITGGLLAYRYRARNTHPVITARGTNIAVPDLGTAFEEAIHFIQNETAPNDPVAVMPEGTSINFLTDRPNPLREEIVTPGFLDEAGEERAIKQLIESNTKLILITNRATSEFGARIFGEDYCERLMQWIEGNFEQHAIFGPDHNSDLQIGDKTFFIRAYRRIQP